MTAGELRSHGLLFSGMLALGMRVKLCNIHPTFQAKFHSSRQGLGLTKSPTMSLAPKRTILVGSCWWQICDLRSLSSPGFKEAMGKDAMRVMPELTPRTMFLTHSQRLGLYESLSSLPGKKGRQGLLRLFYMTLKLVP